MNQTLVYIGTSHTIIEKLIASQLFDFTDVICEAKRITDIYRETVEKYNLKLSTFSTKSSFKKIIVPFKKDSIFLIYQLDIIVPGQLTQKYRFYNLHAGSIKNNRGAHPIIWSILNNDSQTELTLHRINDKIDQGNLICTYPVEITNTDNPLSIKFKMEAGLDNIFDQLVYSIENDIDGKELHGGKYNRPICEEDYTINIYKDSQIIIANKIRSQHQYKGAVLKINDKKLNIVKITSWSNKNNQVETIELKGKFVDIKRNNASFTLEINKESI